MRHTLPAVLATFLLLAGCASAPAPAVAQTAGPPLSEECAAFRFHPVAVWVDAEVIRPGDTAPLRAGSTLGRASGVVAPEPMPMTCLSDWRITPAGAAQVSADGATLTVSPDAPAGAALTLEARTPGEPARYQTRIVGRDEIVLTGRYSQVEVDCGGAELPARPIRELVFGPTGRFSVTWQPFETYTDYWGEFVWDAAAGRLALTITGGNRHPGANARLEGTVEVEADGRLVLNGFNLGDVLNGGAPCRYVFGKT
ncbi:hypothetical protein [Brevundimonas sp.]|uniref:hypothetical protein n=1 Tax=Brevundimonas sp. TaxID=1871086 RepID=UPI002D47413B|nr:hypothetical protein [Brevundimonas sp.]HYC67031.1 hypothetical protein [Brevundimonas sp.]